MLAGPGFLLTFFRAFPNQKTKLQAFFAYPQGAFVEMHCFLSGT